MRRRAREKGQEQAWALVGDVTGLAVRDMVDVWQTLVGVPSLTDCASDGGVVCSNVFLIYFICFLVVV